MMEESARSSGSVPVHAIVVADRFRRELGDLSDLRASMGELGLLSPLVVTPDLTLVAGQRRLEVARQLGWAYVDVRVVADLGSASELLRAERDENTCRKPMTGSELYALGKALEALEGPKSADRQRAALKRGVGSPLASTDANGQRSREAVGAGIGVSSAQWQRLKHIGDRAAQGDPEAQEVMSDIDRGDETIRGGYGRLPKPTPDRPSKPAPDLGNVGSLRTIPRKKNDAGKKLRQLAAKVKDLGQLCSMIELDGLTKEEADGIAADLAEGLSALASLKNQLRKVNP